MSLKVASMRRRWQCGARHEVSGRCYGIHAHVAPTRTHVGLVELAQGSATACSPLANVEAGLASQVLKDDSGELGAAAPSKWVFSTFAGGPIPHSPRGALGATDIVIDVPMDVAAAGGRRASSGGVRRSGDSGGGGRRWSIGGGDPLPALATVEDGVDSSSDGSGSMSSGIGGAAERAIAHAAGAGDAAGDGMFMHDDVEAELAAALSDHDLDVLMDALEDAESSSLRRIPDSLSGFGSMLRRRGVRGTVRASMAHLVDGVVGTVLDDAEVARDAAAAVVTGVRTTAQAGRATMASVAARSTELRKSLRRTAQRATMRRGAAPQDDAEPPRHARRE